MALVALQGVYEDGKIELMELPSGVRKARVLVTFLTEELANEEEAREAARRGSRREAAERMLARMRTGIDFGGEKFDREGIYDERIKELQARRDGSR